MDITITVYLSIFLSKLRKDKRCPVNWPGTAAYIEKDRFVSALLGRSSPFSSVLVTVPLSLGVMMIDHVKSIINATISKQQDVVIQDKISKTDFILHLWQDLPYLHEVESFLSLVEHRISGQQCVGMEGFRDAVAWSCRRTSTLALSSSVKLCSEVKRVQCLNLKLNYDRIHKHP